MLETWQTFDSFMASNDAVRDLPITDSNRWVSYRLEDLYPEWQDRAHCKGTGLEYYFGDDEDGFEKRIAQVRRASKLCEVCPVFRDCLTHALEAREEYGVWAGTSGRVRRKIFKMLDEDETSIPRVVEDFCNGRKAKYTRSGGRRDRGDEGRDGLSNAEGERVAL